MSRRQIKKTVIRYQQAQIQNERQRTRQKNPPSPKKIPQKTQQINMNSRRARLEAMKKKREQQNIQNNTFNQEILVKIQEPLIKNTTNQFQKQNKNKNDLIIPKRQQNQNIFKEEQNDSQQQNQEQVQTIKKPVFISKQYRQINKVDDSVIEQQRKKKSARYTTKLLLQQQKYEDSQEQNENTDSQDQNKIQNITDDDDVQQQYYFQLWKIRELNRIRKANQQRRKHQKQKVQIQRRRTMSNQAIFMENKLLGSDATDQTTQTKYVFMQKYYHKGSFYQDSDDQVFKRDFNLPTPMEMQDKSMLPQILQKRMGNFGKKGQGKYTHLTAQDTSDLNPLTRPDQSLLQYWKQKTAGYKGGYGKKI